jgi:hypothetical protein
LLKVNGWTMLLEEAVPTTVCELHGVVSLTLIALDGTNKIVAAGTA